MLVFIFYAPHGAAAFRNNLIKQQFEYQKEIAGLLAKCTILEK